MAITITSLTAPTNVVATLTPGGTLDANTTYYVVVCAKNENTAGYYITKTCAQSDASVEISFTTDTVNRSATITWDAVTGAVTYNVYGSKVSGYYYYNTNAVYRSGRFATSLAANTTTTNSYNILANPTQYPFDTTGSTTNLNFGVSKYKGIISVAISGTETLSSIYNQIVTAGFGDYVYYDGYNNFLIKGTLRIASGETGSLTITNHNLYIAHGTIRNESTSFTLTIGAYNSTTDSASNGCNIFIDGPIDFILTNINLYDSTIRVGVQGIILYMTIGVQIVMGSNVKYCNFIGIRNTSTDWSNNSVYFPVMMRTWGYGTITNTYYDTNAALNYYPTNGCQSFRDSKFKSNNSGRFAEMVGLAGYKNQPTGNMYDCDFVGAYYNSINDLIFNFSVYESLTGFNFWYSVAATILNENKNLLDGVNVKCYNKDGALIFDKDTTDGLLAKQDVKVLFVQPTGNGTGPNFYTRTFYSPFTLIISKAGYETYKTTLDLVEKFDQIITLKEDGYGDTTIYNSTLIDTNLY
jgi:hypothetical protein